MFCEKNAIILPFNEISLLPELFSPPRFRHATCNSFGFLNLSKIYLKLPPLAFEMSVLERFAKSIFQCPVLQMTWPVPPVTPLRAPLASPPAAAGCSEALASASDAASAASAASVSEASAATLLTGCHGECHGGAEVVSSSEIVSLGVTSGVLWNRGWARVTTAAATSLFVSQIVTVTVCPAVVSQWQWQWQWQWQRSSS